MTSLPAVGATTSPSTASDGSIRDPATQAQANGDNGFAQSILADGSGDAGGGGGILEGIARQSAGRALSAPDQDRLGGAMGVDLGAVRVHTDDAADRFAASVGARAVTAGRDIFFRAGAYEPGTPQGDELLSHELAHTCLGPGASGLSSPGDAAETGAAGVADETLGRLDGDAAAPGDLTTPRARPLDVGSLQRWSDPDGAGSTKSTIKVTGGGGERRIASIRGAAGRDDLTYNDHPSPPGAMIAALPGLGQVAGLLTGAAVGAASGYEAGHAAGASLGRSVGGALGDTAAGAGEWVGGMFGRVEGAIVGGIGGAVAGFGTATDLQGQLLAQLVSGDNQRLNDHLEGVLTLELASTAGGDGTDAVGHFMHARGAARTLPVGSSLSTLAATSPNVLRSVNDCLRVGIQNDLIAQWDKDGSASADEITVKDPPPFDFSLTDMAVPLALRAVIGGAQGSDIFMSAFQFDPATCAFGAMLRVQVHDTFGFNACDIYSPGLMAGYVLQHYSAGHQPYEHILDIAVPVNGSLAAARPRFTSPPLSGGGPTTQA
jgi:hypothetical protein